MRKKSKSNFNYIEILELSHSVSVRIFFLFFFENKFRIFICMQRVIRNTENYIVMSVLDVFFFFEQAMTRMSHCYFIFRCTHEL